MVNTYGVVEHVHKFTSITQHLRIELAIKISHDSKMLAHPIILLSYYINLNDNFRYSWNSVY